MNSLTNDCIAIDTNVFMHLFNPSANTDDHITNLLFVLMNDGIKLAVDDGSVIENEYLEKLAPTIEANFDMDVTIVVLRHWMLYASRNAVTIDPRGQLVKCIKKVIHEPKEKVDRTFVAVVCTIGRILVTNDAVQILWGPPRESPTKKSNRGTRLHKETKKSAARGAEWISSFEANGRL